LNCDLRYYNHPRSFRYIADRRFMSTWCVFFNDRKVGGWFLDVEQNGSFLFLVMYFDFGLVRELCC
jgi:hypothetical protein